MCVCICGFIWIASKHHTSDTSAVFENVHRSMLVHECTHTNTMPDDSGHYVLDPITVEETVYSSIIIEANVISRGKTKGVILQGNK